MDYASLIACQERSRKKIAKYKYLGIFVLALFGTSVWLAGIYQSQLDMEITENAKLRKELAMYKNCGQVNQQEENSYESK